MTQKNKQIEMFKSTVFPVITLYQPWGSWVVWNWKTIETRTHDRFASLKGKNILIHAGQTFDEYAMPAASEYMDRFQIDFASNLTWLDGKGRLHSDYPNGVILGSAHVADFRKLDAADSKAALIDCGDSLIQRYGLCLTDIKKFEHPIRAKGSMGIWYFDLNANQKVNKSK